MWLEGEGEGLVQSDTYPTMEMTKCGDLCMHWGEEGIRLTRVSGRPIKSLSTREAEFLGRLLPIAAKVVDALQGD